MVAISLYRGNLHRVPDVPRRWLMPNPKITLKDFKCLLSRRIRALSRLRPTTSTPLLDSVATGNEPRLVVAVTEQVDSKIEAPDGELNNLEIFDGGDCSVKPENAGNSIPGAKPEVDVKGGDAVNGDGNLVVSQPEIPDSSPNPNPETADKVDEPSDKEKRKKEVKEKLHVLNEKKHNLVQVLKQILNAEEELKRRHSMQGMVNRPSVPFQLDVTNDSGSIIRQVTPRMGSEANLGGDIEGGETEDISNPNVHSRHIHRMSSTSPSSESPHRRPPYFQHNVVPYPSRSSLGTNGSPSRFAPTGHQGHPGNLPAVSVSGTSYIASSPSPAASGGTSAFRDARQPSPWN
ncbi:hypothetical protein K2173_022753 [Erythroxylum novogranatense]|uniref:Uncharacterized protein n=1 Tax=Erythroxylum novogranatense TaxID=1862640 RepID=A0AAV8SMK8_9ROSI|nr:hypothetical protein K2173_022753 [Erythroxylum novogranatense]